MLREQLRPAIMMFIFLTALTGIVYPLTVTGLAQVFFHKPANGSLLFASDGKPVGSALIGQNFDDPQYFWGRLSATTPPYNASASSGSNLGPANPALLEAVKARIAALRTVDPNNATTIPVDLVTASASGLDPQISLAGAYFQLPRVARVRHLPDETVRNIIDQNTTSRCLGILGEPAVNVLKVNLALDEFKK
ncbi:MAG: potassium-transporting ATPase subunit KdpC [Candidatus Omnitrophica bacterium]|nr:potassium-transporting ATPase subunit KdpC [Candidatus Omnitrophota bacterium]